MDGGSSENHEKRSKRAFFLPSGEEARSAYASPPSEKKVARLTSLPMRGFLEGS